MTLAINSRRLDSPSFVLLMMLTFLFSNVATWLNLFFLPFMTPVLCTAALVATVAIALLDRAAIVTRLGTAFPIVVLCYALLNLAGYFAIGGGDPTILFQRILMLAAAVAAYLAFVTFSDLRYWFQRLLILVAYLAVIANAYDITHPFTFVPAGSGFGALGRGAGFYANPNQCGAALVLMLILTVGSISKPWRAAHSLFLTAGVVLTLSRAAMLGSILVMFIFWLLGTLSRRDILIISVVGAAMSALIVLWILPTFLQDSGINVDLALERILWVFDPSGRSDFSQDERAYLADRGLEQFLSSPLWGNGVGSTELWAERSSTHNFYLMQLSDFGIIGAFILPVFAAVVWRARSDGYRVGFLFVVFFLLWGLVSHNLFTEFYWIIALSFVAAINDRTNLDRTPS